MKTYAPRPRDIERRWYVVDADGAVLGRLASEVAKILRGKHKPIFAPHADTGDHVVVVNAAGVRLTGGKETKKIAYHHSGYPGGLRETEYARLMSERPTKAVEKAVRGMLPKNRLGRAMFRKLQVYEGPEHPHSAQKPVSLELGRLPAWDGLPAAEPRAEPAAAKRAEEPPPKRSPAKRTTAKAAAARKRSAAKRTAAKPAAATKRTAAKRGSAKASGAKRPPASRRKKKEDD